MASCPRKDDRRLESVLILRIFESTEGLFWKAAVGSPHLRPDICNQEQSTFSRLGKGINLEVKRPYVPREVEQLDKYIEEGLLSSRVLQVELNIALAQCHQTSDHRL
jgi:hypothetical protein